MKNLKTFLLSALILLFGTYQNTTAQSGTLQNNNDNQRTATGYLKIGDIKGESTDTRRSNTIEVLSFFDGVRTGHTQTSSAAFLKIEGIPGESKDRKHGGWIEINSLNTTENQSRRKGSTTLGDIVVVKEIDASTPKLAESVRTKQVIPKATIVKYDDTNNRQGYYVVKMKNVMVTSYQTGGNASADSVPTEDFSLNFEEIKFEYVKQDEKGQKIRKTLYQSNQASRNR